MTLLSGRPQAGMAASGEMRYYVVRPPNDIATVTVTVTTPVGNVDLYMDLVQERSTIQPTNSSTYR